MDFDFGDVQAQLNSNNFRNQNHTQENYYPQYCRLFLANIALTNQVKQLIEQKNNLKYRLAKYQDQQNMSSYQRNQKAKRFRRNAHEIQRYYKCTVKSCAKSYGSQGSLNQHYKLKHPQIYVTLPNVQSTTEPILKDQLQYIQKLSPVKNFIKNSHSKLNSILKQLGDHISFKSMKIQQLNEYQELMDNKQNKQNFCMNIQQRYQQKSGKKASYFSQKPQFITLTKKQQNFNILTNQDPNLKLKRSSRMIKKRDLNF